jgi:hypothetical protein
MGHIRRYMWSNARGAPALLLFCLAIPMVIWQMALGSGGGEISPEGAEALSFSIAMTVPGVLLSAIATALVYYRPTIWKTNIAFVLFLSGAMFAGLALYVPFHELIEVEHVQSPTVSDLFSKD